MLEYPEAVSSRFFRDTSRSPEARHTGELRRSENSRAVVAVELKVAVAEALEPKISGWTHFLVAVPPKDEVPVDI